ncbi:MAG TPA: GIY-YIG nuclease family protein [Candidatus Hypogeohydataceae bacterium YC41]
MRSILQFNSGVYLLICNVPACLARTNLPGAFHSFQKQRQRQAPTLHYKKSTNGLEIQIGKLGRAFFPEGFYVYVGSAQRSLAQRLERHLRKEKALHWHIDYLLHHAEILSIYAQKASKEWECRLSRRLAGLEGARVVMRGFGSSDCGCMSHLYFFPSRFHLPKIDHLFQSSRVNKEKKSHG